ncbi:MAG: hypothetical protein HC788_02420 [Sphingopyxis sp.]|nr:hypothetical protein [Sphingopyxis sp.]
MRFDATRSAPLSALAVGSSDLKFRWQTGVATLDNAIGGGFALGRIHEVFSGCPEDAAASAGFALALAVRSAEDGKAIIWLRSRRAARAAGVIHAAGWVELGGAPEACLFVLAQDAKALLRAGLDALRCGGLGAVVIESHGAMPELDLTASRRLSFAAEKSGVPLLLLRADAQPVPSAAETRWQVAAAPSQALPGKAPGAPCFDIELLRCRSRPAGQRWRLEWDRDGKLFRDTAVSGAVVPVPLRRQTAERGAGPSRRAA